MKPGPAFSDLLVVLGTAASLEQGLGLTLRRLVRHAGAAAGALAFRPPRGEPLVVVTGGRGPAGDAALRALVSAGRAPRPAKVPAAGRVVVRRTVLGAPPRTLGALALVGPRRALGRKALPAALGRELGAALEQVWRLEQRTLRIRVHNAITRLLVSGDAVDEVLSAFAEGLARLVSFDSVAVSLLDPERPEFEIVDVIGRSVPRVAPRDGRMALDRTLLAQVVASAAPVRVDDLTAPAVPDVSRQLLAGRGFGSALLCRS